MDALVPLLVVIIAVAVGATMWRKSVSSRDELAPEERGRSPEHQELGGGRFDDRNWTAPWVRIALYSDVLVLSYVKRYVIPYAALDAVELHRGVINKGVRLRHHDSSLPQSILLWSRQPEELFRRIAAHANNPLARSSTQ